MAMIRKVTLAALMLGSCGIATVEAQEYRTLSREEIRAMPITERPSRPGHFYGNAVRRMNARKMQQAQQNPWQGYGGGGRTQMGGYNPMWYPGP